MRAIPAMGENRSLRTRRAGPTIRLLPFLLAAVAAWDAGAAPTRRLGLILGANDGGNGRARLQYAGDDARTFAQSMLELGGMDARDLILLHDVDAGVLSRSLDLFAGNVREAKRGGGRVEAVVFYSGHADEHGLLLKGQRMTFADFRAKVDGIPADVRIAVVDACASGALTRLKGGRDFPSFLSDESSQASGYAFLTSSSADEASQESDRIRASYFSHFLNAGLRGAADASQDGRVTLHEAYQYAYDETLARTETSAGGPQHASYDMRISGSGDVVMTELVRARAAFRLPSWTRGRFFIRDARGNLVAEVEKPAGRPLSFALEPGTYAVRWHREGAIRERSVTLASGAPASLEPGPGWKDVAPEPSQARGTASAEPRLSQVNLFRNRSPEDFRGTQLAMLSNRSDGGLDGQQMSLGLNAVQSGLRGIQVAAIMNTARGPVDGGQVAFLANWAGGDLRGLQAGSLLNRAQGMTEGFQGSGGLNYLEGDAGGVQASGGINVVRGSLAGLQGAVFANYIGGDLRGGSVGMALNVAGGDVKGSQVAGGVNFAAGSVDGYQIGLINIARSYRRGAPIGVLNVVGDGVWRGDAWVDETGITHLGLVTGSRHVNTRLAFGSKIASAREVDAFSLEAAGHLPWRAAFLELGLMSALISVDGRGSVDYQQRLRLTAGGDFGRYVSLAAGVSWVAAVTPEAQAPWTGGNRMQRSSFDGRLHQWPGAHVSLRAGVGGRN